MLIELVHANGHYSSEANAHIPPRGIEADSYYSRVSAALRQATRVGATVLYRPNLISFTHNIVHDPSAIERALAADPVIDELKGIAGLVVLPDGLYPFEQRARMIRQEDSLLRQCGRAIVIGAYTNVCVPDVAYNLSSRNPGYSVGIDSSLSVNADYEPVRPEYGRVMDFSLRAELAK